MNDNVSKMKPDPHREAALFQAALQLTGSARASFLENACAGDPALRQRLEALLAADEQPEGALAESAPAVKATMKIEFAEVPDETIGQKIGRYKILEKVGEGGCGVVYVADQSEPVRRRVALKVIKLGMDTKQVVARFEAERQALAMMDHPNIAKVLDAGSTESGRPYFIMELVRGIRITDYCDQNKLSTEERLKLFIQVCNAIQHAHQKGIIHRDIKPSNILVTLHDGVPVPKVIDFGIAKATEGRLTDATVYTQLHQFIGTPAYMSPEQAEMSGLDVDTRSDIYSLGVLLYELLTGKTPFDGKELVSRGIDAMRQTIREKEPTRPSTALATLQGEELTTTARRRSVEPSKLARQLREDLDWIVMKCLEKDRTRRYNTANGLASDIQRHLNNEPVVACPPSKLYEFQKTVRRHKVGFAAAGAIIFILLVGVLVSTWQAVRATRAQHAALAAGQQADEARNNEVNLREQAQADEKKAQTEAARSAQVAQFMKDMLAAVGPKVAQGRDTTLLREILDNTAQRLDEGLAGQPEVEADLRHTLGVVYRDIGDYAKAAPMLEKAYSLRKKRLGEDNIDTVNSLYFLADVYRLQGRDAKAESAFRKVLEARRKLLGNDSPDTAASLYGLAEETRRTRERLPEAEAEYREALRIQQSTPGYEAASARSLCGLAIVLKSETTTNSAEDEKLVEAEKCFRAALEIQRAKLPDQPDTAYTLSNFGYMLNSVSGKRDEAEKLLREAVAIQKKVLGDHRDTAMSLYFLAATVTNTAEAGALSREALNMRRKVLGDAHRDTEFSEQQLFKFLEAQGKSAEAENLMRDMLGQQEAKTSAAPAQSAMSSTAPAMTPGDLERLREKYGNNDARVASGLARLAQSVAMQGKLAEAQPYLNEALTIEETLPESDKMKLIKTLRSVGFSLLRSGKYREAEAFYRPAMKWQRTLSSSTSSDLSAVSVGLIRALEGQHKDAEVLEILRNAAELGVPNLSCRLGEMLETGSGVARDEQEAVHWYLKAADQGDAEAQFLLGQMYAGGRGVARDETQASQWFRKASESTDADSLNGLSWFLATSTDDTIRDGTNALIFAERAVAFTSRTNDFILDTLAGAYAEAGQFQKAISTEQEAIALRKDEKVSQNRGYLARLKLYEENKPYRESIYAPETPPVEVSSQGGSEPTETQ